jgi:hypothetical protein
MWSAGLNDGRRRRVSNSCASLCEASEGAEAVESSLSAIAMPRMTVVEFPTSLRRRREVTAGGWLAPESSRLRPDGCGCRTVRDLPVFGEHYCGAERLLSLRVQLWCCMALTAAPNVFRGPSRASQSPIGRQMPSRGTQGSIGHGRRLDRRLARRIPVRKLRSPWDGPG